MGSKTAAKSKASPTKKRPAEHLEEEEAELGKPMQQNMLNQLKASKSRIMAGRPAEGDEEKAAALDRYQSLSRFSSEKRQMLELWSKDKSCGWYRTYEEHKGSKYQEATKGLVGYGSKCGSFNCLFHWVNSSYVVINIIFI